MCQYKCFRSHLGNLQNNFLRNCYCMNLCSCLCNVLHKHPCNYLYMFFRNLLYMFLCSLYMSVCNRFNNFGNTCLHMFSYSFLHICLHNRHHNVLCNLKYTYQSSIHPCNSRIPIRLLLQS